MAWVTIVWTAFALIGLGYSISNFIDANRDYRVVRAIRPSNGRYILARAQVRNEFFRCVMLLCFVLIGVMALTLPARPPTAQSYVISAVFIIGELTVVYNSYANKRVRAQLLADLHIPSSIVIPPVVQRDEE